MEGVTFAPHTIFDETSLCHCLASPANDRVIEYTLTHKVAIHVLISLAVQPVFVKALMNSDLKHKREFFEIFQTNVTDADKAVRFNIVVIEVKSCLYQKANEAG